MRNETTASQTMQELVRDLYNFQGGIHFALRLEKILASQPKSIGDDAQFNVLADAMCWNYVENYVNGGSAEKAQQAKNSRRNFIEYVDNFRAPAAQASATIQAAPDEHPDNAAVQAFADAMKAKMAKSRAKGRGGWEECHAEDLRRMLVDHMAKGDPVDVGNFAMMLWNRGESTAATIQEPVMVAEPAGDLISDIKKAIRLADAVGVSRADNRYARNEKAVEELVDLELSIYRRLAAPMVADPAGVAFDREEFIRQVSVSVAEMDRDSPEGQPEMMLVTPDELQNTMRSVFDRFDEAATVKAVPSEALELAAQKCDELYVEFNRDDYSGQSIGARCCAAAIREMKIAAPLADKTGGGE